MLRDFHAHFPSRQTLHQRTATTISLSTITIESHVPLSILLSYSTTQPYPLFHTYHSSHKALCMDDGQHLSFTSILRVVRLMHTSSPLRINPQPLRSVAIDYPQPFQSSQIASGLPSHIYHSRDNAITVVIVINEADLPLANPILITITMEGTMNQTPLYFILSPLDSNPPSYQTYICMLRITPNRIRKGLFFLTLLQSGLKVQNKMPASFATFLFGTIISTNNNTHHSRVWTTQELLQENYSRWYGSTISLL